MSGMELRSILGKSLSAREKSKLNERCVLELQKELKSAQTLISQNVWEISNLKKELQKREIKINHMESKQILVANVINKQENSDNEQGETFN